MIGAPPDERAASNPGHAGGETAESAWDPLGPS